MSNDVRVQLQHLADRRERAVDEHREASAELRSEIQRAIDEGIPVVEIARLAGLSRSGVYKLLRRPS